MPTMMKNRLALAYSASAEEIMKFINELLFVDNSVVNHVYAITFMDKSQMSVFIIANKTQRDNSSTNLWAVELDDFDYINVCYLYKNCLLT
jgi:hypothetical protein